MRKDAAMDNSESNLGQAVREFASVAGPMFQALAGYPVALTVCDVRALGAPIIFSNAAFSELTGYSAEEALGNSLSFLSGQKTDRATATELIAALGTGAPFEAKILHYTKDGKMYWSGVSVSHVATDSKAAFVVVIHTDVTAETKKAAAEADLLASQVRLDEANERLRLTLSLTGAAAAWEWDIGRNRIVGDPRFAAVYGIRPEEAAAGVSPNVFFSIIHADDLARVRLAIGGILRGAEVFSKEFRIILQNHSVRWVHARGRCHYDQDDRPIRFNGVFIDITEQRLGEERLRIAQSAGGIGTFEYIEGFGTATVSAQFCTLLGLQPARDLPVHTINAVVDKGEPPLIGAAPKGAAVGLVHSEVRIVRPDTGEIRWLVKRGEYLRDADIAGPRFSGVIYDITNSKRIEETLRTLNETLETRVDERTRERDGIWQLSRDLLAISDASGVWLSVNPAWTRILGWQADEIVGRDSRWLQHPDDSDRTHLPLDANDGASASFQTRLRTRQGDYRSLAWNAVSQSGLIYWVARDVTDQLRREDSLARAEEQLRQSHKMEAVGQLTGGIAHDFNNMLTGVIASLGLIQRRLKAGRTDGLNEFIEAGMNSASRAATLTHSLLAFARRQSLDVKSQDINALISGIQEILRRPLGENIAFELKLDRELWNALTDANQFENALLNLAINARDAMPEGGRLRIETANTVVEEATSAHDGEISTGDYVVVSVTDTGIGMPPDIIAKAFEPFFTTKPIGQGTGLGLSMIYGFVKQSGGHVRIASKVDQGTTVSIYLRRARTNVGVSEEAPGLPLRRGRGETVLVVEDDESVRFTIAELLKELGYQYFAYADASAAVPHLQSKRRVDLLLSDVGLPNMNGRQLAELGRQHRPNLKVLLISGYTEKATDRSGFLGHGMQMLGKPFTVDTLAAKIRALLED
jgi:PAS domain S-box-containing protein